jgi:chromosome-anchoring protein RacA
MSQQPKKRNGGNFGLKYLASFVLAHSFILIGFTLSRHSCLQLILSLGGFGMNTSEVAKLLGVSSSTIQRWVKQLELPMEKNERGHYHFSSEDIEQLKEIHEKLQAGTLLHEISPLSEKKSIRKGIVKTVENDQAMEKLFAKVKELELSLHAKADSVASYQLLQHRREIEELQEQVKNLSHQMEQFQSQLNELTSPLPTEKPLVFDQTKAKRKKKNFMSSLLGFL